MSKRIALFASGSGSNVENIIQYFKGTDIFEFPVVICNKPNAFVHERAKALNVPSVNFTRDEFSTGEKIVECLQHYRIDYIVLAGFLLKVPDVLVAMFPEKIINIHPALLPKHGGRGMYGMHVHQAVVDGGDKESGITIHYVNEHYDEGNIIFQARCVVDPTDSPEQVAHKVHELEYEHFPRVIESLWANVH